MRRNHEVISKRYWLLCFKLSKFKTLNIKGNYDVTGRFAFIKGGRKILRFFGLI